MLSLTRLHLLRSKWSCIWSCSGCHLSTYSTQPAILAALNRNAVDKLLKPVRGRFAKPSVRTDSVHLTFTRRLSTTTTQFKKKDNQDEDDARELVLKGFFSDQDRKSKETYQTMIEYYKEKEPMRKGHCEFIYAALASMKEFGVHRDMATYKMLLDVFPKGKFIATNLWQVELMHYPKQQYCGIELLAQMEEYGIQPDTEVGEMLLNIFGKHAYPYRRFCRMMYWTPKFKNASPFPLADPLPNNALELAKIALKRITDVDYESELDIYDTADLAESLHKTWIVGAQSVTQQRLIAQHDVTRPLYVEGAFRVWLRRESVNYFILRADPLPIIEKEEDTDAVDNLNLFYFRERNTPETALPTLRTVHEQDDGVILAACATGTSTRDSLLSWVRFLQRTNPKLAKIPVLFTLRSPLGTVVPIDQHPPPPHPGGGGGGAPPTPPDGKFPMAPPPPPMDDLSRPPATAPDADEEERELPQRRRRISADQSVAQEQAEAPGVAAADDARVREINRQMAADEFLPNYGRISVGVTVEEPLAAAAGDDGAIRIEREAQTVHSIIKDDPPAMPPRRGAETTDDTAAERARSSADASPEDATAGGSFVKRKFSKEQPKRRKFSSDG